MNELKTKVQVDKFLNKKGETVYRFYPRKVWDEIDYIGEDEALAAYPRSLWEWTYSR